MNVVILQKWYTMQGLNIICQGIQIVKMAQKGSFDSIKVVFLERLSETLCFNVRVWSYCRSCPKYKV